MYHLQILQMSARFIDQIKSSLISCYLIKIVCVMNVKFFSIGCFWDSLFKYCRGTKIHEDHITYITRAHYIICFTIMFTCILLLYGCQPMWRIGKWFIHLLHCHNSQGKLPPFGIGNKMISVRRIYFFSWQ